MSKEIKDMTEKEILRQQLELLAEYSTRCAGNEIAGITSAMLNVVAYLSSSDCNVL